MAFCPKCGNQIPDDCKLCAACGAQLDANAQPAPNVIPPMVDPADHTAEFTKEDISQNKIMAMAAYILGTVGIIIALLAAPQSPLRGIPLPSGIEAGYSHHPAFSCHRGSLLDIHRSHFCRHRRPCTACDPHHLFLPGMLRQGKGCRHRRRPALLQVIPDFPGLLHFRAAAPFCVP